MSKFNGKPLDAKAYVVTDVNAFAMDNGWIRDFAGLMDIMTDDEVRATHTVPHRQGRLIARRYINRARFPTAARWRKVAGASEEPTMNGNNQPQQEQHHIAERVAHLETAIDYQGKAMQGLREEVRDGFTRVDTKFGHVDAEFVRVHEQLMKIRTSDFRILVSITLTTALGTVSLILKVFGVL